MQSNFSLFGPVHILILSLIPALAGLLTVVARKAAYRQRMRRALAIFLLLDSAAWYGYLAMGGLLKFPDTLPLELCDVSLYLTVAALITLRPLVFEFAYYGALAGTGMALLTPDLWEPFPSYGTVQFFVAHGSVIVAILFLIWTKQARPRPGSVWRAMLAVNAFAAAVGAFNFVSGTNYMYLRKKPANPSLLDYLGEWPWYILTSEAVALILFTLLWLPFRRQPA